MFERNMRKTCCDIRYKAIFSDIQMPVMDGITAMKIVQEREAEFRRADPTRPKVHIAFVSSFDAPDVIQQCKDIGVTDYLTKPVAFKSLLPICSKVFLGSLPGSGPSKTQN